MSCSGGSGKVLKMLFIKQSDLKKDGSLKRKYGKFKREIVIVNPKADDSNNKQRKDNTKEK